MKFDVFHSIGRIDTVRPKTTDRQVFERFFAEVQAAEALGYGTIWVAESHFSSEVQKQNPGAVIPHYRGEVGLNCDSLQLAQSIFAVTRRLGFGTAIMNIVGGNGGPIAAADRVRTLAFLNSLAEEPRQLAIGVASGRFPYINQPFGIVPRSPVEKAVWRELQQAIFAEALEIFLRLSTGEILSSKDLSSHKLTRASFKDDAAFAAAQTALAALDVRLCPVDGLAVEPRWRFDALKLVPDLPMHTTKDWLRFVLGSSCPLSQTVGMRFADLDVFNLSFTPPSAIDQAHASMTARCEELGRTWHRGRMPRTVLVFIDENPARAEQRASQALDTYIEAMRGTAQVPDKRVLMERALIGDAEKVRRQLQPDDPHGFHADDRLMLWFEFNQTDGDEILGQMRRFAEQVMPHAP